jgi:hypothetical protein
VATKKMNNSSPVSAFEIKKKWLKKINLRLGSNLKIGYIRTAHYTNNKRKTRRDKSFKKLKPLLDIDTRSVLEKIESVKRAK